jgi:hypothetical protein
MKRVVVSLAAVGAAFAVAAPASAAPPGGGGGEGALVIMCREFPPTGSKGVTVITPSGNFVSTCKSRP